MNQKHYARKRRQLQVMAKKLQHLLIGQAEDITVDIEKLVLKIKKLVQELLIVFSHSDLKKLLGASAIFIGVSFTNQTTAQSFAPPLENPFGLVSANYWSLPTFADLDGDGDFDLLVGEYYGAMQYFENTGTASNPQFATPLENPFGLDTVNYIALPSFVDLDGDGDMDILVGESYGGMQYFENTGTESNPQFASPQGNPFGLVPTNSFAAPAFADLDGDGDFDLLVGEYPGSMQYFENTGSVFNPQFAAPQVNPFGLDSTYVNAFPAFADLDEDGDLDLLVGYYYGGMKYFENIGSASNPQFADPLVNPFGLTPTYDVALPAFADLDNDGDMDLLVGEYYGAMQFFENTTITTVSELSQDIDLSLFPNPVQDILTIETKEVIKKVEIFNMLGETVIAVENPINQISLSELNTGVYMVKVSFVKGEYVMRKVQKQ